jgi:hypothetical protein
MKEANAANATAASATLQAALDSAASVAESESVDEEKVVKVEVDSVVDTVGDVKTTRTNVIVEMPAGSAELPLPEDTTEMIEKAKEMVAEARKLEAESSKTPARKRKSDELDSDDIDSDLPAQPTKRARVLEEKLKRQKVRTRAFIGISATLAIGYVVHHFPRALSANLSKAPQFPISATSSRVRVSVLMMRSSVVAVYSRTLPAGDPFGIPAGAHVTAKRLYFHGLKALVGENLGEWNRVQRYLRGQPFFPLSSGRATIVLISNACMFVLVQHLARRLIVVTTDAVSF